MGLLQQVNVNTLGLGLMAAGGGMVMMSMMPQGTLVNLAPPGTPNTALLVGGVGMVGLGTAFSIIQPPKQ